MEPIHELAAGENFDDYINGADKPVLVDFHAEWCGPCKKLGPILEEKQKASGKFYILKVNVDDHGDLAEKYEVSGIPHVVLFKGGKPVSVFTGFNIPELEKMVGSL